MKSKNPIANKQQDDTQQEKQQHQKPTGFLAVTSAIGHPPGRSKELWKVWLAWIAPAAQWNIARIRTCLVPQQCAMLCGIVSLLTKVEASCYLALAIKIMASPQWLALAKISVGAASSSLQFVFKKGAATLFKSENWQKSKDWRMSNWRGYHFRTVEDV